MGTENTRSSDRVYLELPIIIAGTDATGRNFEEETKTLVVSRRGAKIISRYSLAPQQKLRIRCLKTHFESDLRVVGPIGGEEEGYYYGVEVLEAGTNFWGIEFPALPVAGKAASRVLLECTRCHSQEVVYLDVFELEVFLANESLMRPCSKCAGVPLWMPPVREGGEQAIREVPPSPSPAINKRKDPRINLNVKACIRHPEFGDEIVRTENVSRGGFRFRSKKDYAVATLIEAALPYVPGAANIFAFARITYKEDLPAEGMIAYGVAYMPTQMASSLTGMRISRHD